MKRKPESDEDEFSVDEPEEFQEESDDDWTPQASEAKGRRQPLRGTRKRAVVPPSDSTESSSEEEEEDEEDSDKEKNQKGKKSTGQVKKLKRFQPKPGTQKPVAAAATTTSTTSGSKTTTATATATTTTRSTAGSVNVQEVTSTTPSAIVEKEFSSGAFIVLKADLKDDEDPPIWKIDGKALLQKYTPFQKDGKTLYQNTSTYSGWSISHKSQYYPAPINFKTQNKKEIIVEFLRDEVTVSADEAEESE